MQKIMEKLDEILGRQGQHQVESNARFYLATKENCMLLKPSSNTLSPILISMTNDSFSVLFVVFVVLLFCCFVVLLFCCFVVLLFCCFVVLLFLLFCCC